MIGIISYPEDKHAQVIMQKLSERGEKSILLDFSQYPSSWELSYVLSQDGIKVQAYANAILATSAGIKSVWNRRRKGRTGQGTGQKSYKSYLERYIDNESEQFLSALSLTLSKCIWVSDPFAVRKASHKPYQLLIAPDIGFKIPSTCIGNSPKTVKEFLKEHGCQHVVIKAVDMAYVLLQEATENIDPKEDLVIYSKKISSDEVLGNLGMTRNCPVIVQEVIEKVCDIRVTVVDDKVFAAAIYMEQTSDSDIVDWRHSQVPIRYEKHDLPKDISEKCVSLVKFLGLKFGCIDLGLSPNGEYIFFEINPSGQWLASEQKAGLEISDALITILTAGG